jgi:hypothetical protein
MCPHNNAGPSGAGTGAENSSEPSAKRLKLDDDVCINSVKSQGDAER